MALPINIHELLHGRVVETERLEFKEGWNPDATLHTMCAFANDINNWGGGYIVIGIEDKKGVPVFPPKGLSPAELARIQKEILNLSHKIKPEYSSIVDVTKYEGHDIIIIWVPGGTHRPYKAPVSLAKGAEYAYYIRRNATTKRASISDERGLMKLAENIPFDDRVNHKASLDDLEPSLIREYLVEIGSDLAKETKMPFEDLCQQMNIAEGPKEYLRPKNIGLMLFSNNPQKFFPVAQIDVVEFEDEVGDVFSEKIFKGPIHQQVRAALAYLKNSVIKEFVRKVPDRAEADRFFNYPYVAIEEILVNAAYHRSYEEREPVEVRVYPDRILVLSYPGPLPPLGKKNINKSVVTSHMYRNRRLGDFFKELHLTEGRCTGFPKIRRAMRHNGSPAVVYETDEDRVYFMATIKIHPKAKETAEQISSGTGGETREKTEQVSEQVDEQVSEQAKVVLEYCRQPRTKQEILLALHLAPVYLNYKRHIYSLLQEELLGLTVPEKPNSRLQKYKTTPKGLLVLRDVA